MYNQIHTKQSPNKFQQNYLPYDLVVWSSAEVPEELHDEPLAVSDDFAVVVSNIYFLPS
jgi:hypothetical protein